MARRMPLNRPLNTRISDAAWRRLRDFAAENGISEGEALTFLFENFGSVTDDQTLPHRLRLFRAELDASGGTK